MHIVICTAFGKRDWIKNMKLIFTEQKNFTEQQVQDLFLSVGWVSGQYPSRLHKALLHNRRRQRHGTGQSHGAEVLCHSRRHPE